METKYNLHIVSHTHWDREWYLSFQVFRRKFVKMMDRLISLFAENDEFKHFMLDGQTMVLNDYLEVRPEQENKIKKLIREGKLLIGPWFSQPNEFLVSGEAMIRNLMLGRRECRDYGGRMNICYIPDGFGHISQLPLIIKGFGMSDVVVCRGLPKGSRTVFNWKGADGTECHVFYMYGTYGNAAALPLSKDGYEEYLDSTPVIRKGLMERIKNIVDELSERTTNKNLLLMNGVDHAFAQEDLPDVIKKINCLFPEVDAFHSTLEEYILSVKKEHEKNGTRLEYIEGELRDSTEVCILPGSQSTRSDVKMFNNKIEGLLEKWVEPFSCVSWMLGYECPQSEIWKSWEYILENHAHDSLACSSTDSTYHQVMTRFEWAHELAEDLSNESLQRICRQIRLNNLDDKKGIILAVFNPLNWQRSEVVSAVLDIPKTLSISHLSMMDEEKPVFMKIHNSKETQTVRFNPKNGLVDLIPVDRYFVTFLAKDIPAFGFKAFRMCDGARPSFSTDRMLKSDRAAENEYIRVKINSNGTLNLLDKRTGYRYNAIHYFEDSGEAGDGFLHAEPMSDRIVYSTGCCHSVSIIEETDIKVTFKVEFEMDLPENLTNDRKARSNTLVTCAISSFITIMAETPRVDIKTIVKNRSGGHRLRVVFPTGIKADYSYAEQPFDVVKRKIKLPFFDKYPEGFEEAPSATHPQLSFAGITDGENGLMIANYGLYEYEVKDNEDRSIAVTLMRCTNLVYEPYLNNLDEGLMPEAECLGDYEFHYSIIPHQGSWENSLKSAYEFRFPVKAVIRRSLEEEVMPNCQNIKEKTELPSEYSFITLGDPDLMVSALKKCEDRDSIIIRLFNPTTDRIDSWFRVCFPGVGLIGAYVANLSEEREAELQFDKDGILNIKIEKKSVLTVELIFESIK